MDAARKDALSGIRRAEAAEREVAELRAQMAAMQMAAASGAGARGGTLLSSTSASRLRVEAAEREAAALRKQLAAKEAASAVRQAETNRALKEAQAKLEVMKVREEKASIDRAKNIKTIVLHAFQLDLAFLVDITGSMQSSIKMVYDRIAYIAERIVKQHPRTAINAAFVGYRDYSDAKLIEKLDFVKLSGGKLANLGSTGLVQFRNFLGGVKCEGGGDDAEDVFSGLEAVASLSWSSKGSRLLVHIADAPCHGSEFHTSAVRDDFPGGDKQGRRIQTILEKLRVGCNIKGYYFAHLNTSTTQMLQKFKAAAAGDRTWIQDDLFTNIDALPEKIVILSVMSISTAFKDGVLGISGGYIQKSIKPEKPNWGSVIGCEATAWRLPASTMDPEGVIRMVRNKETWKYELFTEMTIKIAPYPFSNDGAGRWPYYAKVVSDTTRSPISDFVVKRFKDPLGKPVNEVHKKGNYEDQVLVQSVAAVLQREYNRKCRENKIRSKKVAFSQVSMLEVKQPFGREPMYYNIEKELKGEFIKYSNNAGYVNTKDFQATLQAFSHWTYDFSGGALMVTDLQGTLDREEGVFWLCDPAIHSSADLLGFGKTNLGEDGYKLFFESHICNHICKKLGLRKHPSQPAEDSASPASRGSSRPGSVLSSVGAAPEECTIM